MSSVPDNNNRGPDPPFLLVLGVLGLDIALLAGLAYTVRYTVTQRSGLNDPEKLRRIWSRSHEIRFQPVFKAMAFSIAVAYGAPAVLVSLAVTLIGAVLPQFLFLLLSAISAFALLLISGAIGPMVYRASGGQRVVLCIVAMCGFATLISGLTLYEVMRKGLTEKHVSATAQFLLYTLVPLSTALLQVPFAVWGARKEMPEPATRIYNPTLVPDWVRLNRVICIAAAPLILAYLYNAGVQKYVGFAHYFARVATLLASLTLYTVAGLSAIISVNRALLAEDFRWQWRAFLTPAVPLGAVSLVFALVSYIKGDLPSLLSVLLIVLEHICTYGASGALGAYLYLYLAEQYARRTGGINIPEEESGGELFGSDVSGDEDAAEV